MRAPARIDRRRALRREFAWWLTLALIAPLSGGCGGGLASTSTTETLEEPARPERVAIALRFEDGRTNLGTNAPRTRLVLAVVRESGTRTETHEIAIVDGACTYVAPAGDALAAGNCWWSGSGRSYDVARVGAEVVVRRIVTDEEGPPRPPETVLRVTLPEDAQVQVIAPETMR